MTHMRKHSTLALAVSAALYLTASPAIAQEDGAEDDSGLEVITVSAQKRAQNLQEVPVAVTAITGDQMAESVIKDVYDLTTSVPGLAAFQSQSATNSSFSIRGVGTSSQNFGLESSVGLYVDGVYRSRQNSMINNLVDVEAVEVLRGPQGTLFGKNTPSGAILVKTIAPSHDGDDGFVELTLGNFGLVNYAGAASWSAIEDVLAFRATIFGGQRDGIISDVNLGDDTINDRDRWGGRLQALYTPNDDFSLRIIADYSEIDEICCGAPVQLSNLQATNVPGRFGTDAVLPGLGGTVFPGGDAFFDREVAVSFLPVATMEDSGLSAEINYSIDDNFSIVSVSAVRNFDSFDRIDSDFTDAPLFGTENDSSQSSFSQELRLDYVSKNLNYILGAYYFTQDLDLDYNLFTDSLFNEFFLASTAASVDGLTGVPGSFNSLLDGINALSATGLVGPVAPAAPANTNFIHTAQQEHESYAIFGQFDYKFNDKWTITAGLRYTDETKDLSTVFDEQGPGINGLDNANTPDFGTALFVGANLAANPLFLADPANIALTQGAFAPFATTGWGFLALGTTTRPRANIVETLEDDQITGTLKLSWQPDSDTLIYGSYGTGYKSGGTNTDRITEGFNPLFDAEKSKSFELGIKKDFPDQNFRINAAAHTTKVEDFQANTFTGNGFNLQNAGDFKIWGYEVEATWVPADSVEVNFAYAKVNAEYETFLAGNCWVAFEFHNTPDGTAPADPGRTLDANGNLNPFCDRTGDRPGGEPEDYAVLKIKKDIDINDDIYAYAQIEFSYTSDIILDGSNDPLAVQDGYNLVNARFFMNFSEYDMDLVFWGRNIFDEEYINRTNFNTPIQEGKLNAYVTEPATYGVTLKKRF